MPEGGILESYGRISSRVYNYFKCTTGEEMHQDTIVCPVESAH